MDRNFINAALQQSMFAHHLISVINLFNLKCFVFTKLHTIHRRNIYWNLCNICKTNLTFCKKKKIQIKLVDTAGITPNFLKGLNNKSKNNFRRKWLSEREGFIMLLKKNTPNL